MLMVVAERRYDGCLQQFVLRIGQHECVHDLD